MFQRASKTCPEGLWWNLPPQKWIPATLRLRHMGREIFRWSHSAMLSPVHIAPTQTPTCEYFRDRMKSGHRRFASTQNLPPKCSFISPKVLPYRWVPAKKDLPRTKGRSVPPDLWIKPSAVAICCGIKEADQRSTKSPFMTFYFYFGGQVRSQNRKWFQSRAQNSQSSLDTRLRLYSPHRGHTGCAHHGAPTPHAWHLWSWWSLGRWRPKAHSCHSTHTDYPRNPAMFRFEAKGKSQYENTCIGILTSCYSTLLGTNNWLVTTFLKHLQFWNTFEMWNPKQ